MGWLPQLIEAGLKSLPLKIALIFKDDILFDASINRPTVSKNHGVFLETMMTLFDCLCKSKWLSPTYNRFYAIDYSILYAPLCL